jgi:hypothetical protein
MSNLEPIRLSQSQLYIFTILLWTTPKMSTELATE